MMQGPTTLPPKMAREFAARAKRMDGCVRIGDRHSDMYEFAQGNNVICLISLDPPMGHFGKDVRRADAIRLELAKVTAA